MQKIVVSLLAVLLSITSTAYASPQNDSPVHYPSSPVIIPKEYQVFGLDMDSGFIDTFGHIEDDLYLLQRHQKAADTTYAFLGKKNGKVIKIDAMQYGPNSGNVYFGVLDSDKDKNGNLYLLVYYSIDKTNSDGSVDLEYIQVSSLKYQQGSLVEVDKLITKKLPDKHTLDFSYGGLKLWASVLDNTSGEEKLVITDLYKWDFKTHKIIPISNK
ncbi:hypothetical protein BP422_03675 [Brevibacillus formosus]|uniref:Uncharacterized protein n=1 Tax=Brevibacillus formosus TaxID=54913 RepID=A0A220MCL3_9BACL|nr:hypothetical protein [Brevibacillus formosus]ASJ52732.1 hypothetical protein BP422_03675 [Brevibacillus formosus]